jgi:glycine/D-amino acid oxidase-like deaminating enzyme
VNERALSIVGPFSFEVVDVIRGHAHEVVVKKAVVGCLAALTLEVDGRKIRIVEAGDVEGAAAQEDGANLKEAASDAFKRCWMRTGLGLHLWSQADYFLDKQLDKDAVLPPAEEHIGEELTHPGTGRELIEIPVALGETGVLDDPERPFE